MELFSDAENPQMADDGIDIDLDLTSDPPRNEEDEVMIEDLDTSVLEKDIQPNIVNSWDDQMVDDPEQDDHLQHDDNLNTVGLEESAYDQDWIIDDREQEPRPPDSKPIEVQDTLQNIIRYQNSTHNLPQVLQTAAQTASQSSTYEPMTMLDDVATDDLGKPKNIPTLYQHQGEQGIHETQPEFVRSHLVPEDTVDALRTSGIASFDHEIPAAAQVAEDTAGGDLGQRDNVPISDQEIDLAGRDRVEKSEGNHASPRVSIQEWSDPVGKDTEGNPLESENDNSLPQVGEEEDFYERSHSPTAAVLHSNQEAASQEPPYIHQVVVVYEGSEMFLFPPAEHEQDLSQTYFLSDEALAAEPLYNLFRECRNVLGESISDKEELQITIEVLGLSICESTVDGSSTTLLDILDVFLQLHAHDGIEDPPHMGMILSTSTRFSDRLRFLLDFVADGKGMSHLRREEYFEDATSPEHLPEPNMPIESDETDKNLASPDALEQTNVQGDHEEHTLLHASKQAEHSSNISFKLPRGDNASRLKDAEFQPVTESIGSTNTVHSVTDRNIDSSAENLVTESSNAASPLQALDEPADDQYDDELEEEEDLNEEDDDADPKEWNSTSSYTVRGDDTLGVKNNFAMSTEPTNLHGPSEKGQQLFHENLEAEDVLTNEDLEADLDNLDNLDNLDELGLDTQWHDTQELDSTLVNASSARDVSTLDPDRRGNSDFIDSSLGNSLGVPVDGKTLEMPHDGRNQSPMDNLEDEQANREDTLTISQSNDSNALNDQPSETTNRSFGHGQETSYISGPDRGDTRDLPVDGQRDSAWFKDDIDFDDLEDDATVEDLPGVSTELHSEPAGTSSPGALKRARADDEVASLEDDPTLDPKRERVRLKDHYPYHSESVVDSNWRHLCASPLGAVPREDSGANSEDCANPTEQPKMVEDKYIGLALAIVSTMAIGTSFVITKKGLLDASERHGFEGDGFAYLKSPTWWGGIVTMVVGEVANFAAYAYAPAILVTPLGALSVLIGAVLGASFLKEELGTLGKLGCAMCLIGSVIIVLHAPPDKDIKTVDEILHYAIHPGFLFYCAAVAVFSSVMIYRVAPQHGKKNPLIYISICSTVGSISVMSVKAFGIALKLTLGGSNQFTYPSTYVFIIITVVCILTQMNYFNKALSQFSTSLVNPLYYVTFTTATLCASFILFRGFNTTDAVNTISLLSGFLVIFTGVYLLNLSRGDPNGSKLLGGKGEDGIPTDGITGLQTRASMQTRRSVDARETSSGSTGFGSRGDREGLIHSYDEENGGFGLTDLAEDSEEDDETRPPNGNGRIQQHQRYTKVEDQ
ncbi:MAG: hypothetical protein Q9194_001173 [Teloschistes cf. exilis]